MCNEFQQDIIEDYYYYIEDNKNIATSKKRKAICRAFQRQPTTQDSINCIKMPTHIYTHTYHTIIKY